MECANFSEDLATSFFVATDVRPQTGLVGKLYCIKNVGSQMVTVSVTADELSDVDFACTGDEEIHGDTSCGNDGQGELSRRVSFGFFPHPQCSQLAEPGPGDSLAGVAQTPAVLGQLNPGEERCFSIEGSVGGDGQGNQQAQTDRVTWRFKWIAQA